MIRGGTWRHGSAAGDAAGAIAQAELAAFGAMWQSNGGRLSRTPPYSSGQLGRLFDTAVGTALAVMLGGISVAAPNPGALTPAMPDCVEVGPVRVIGGVRPQNFDVGYRPDGVRFAFDSKTLNDQESIGKNWQNMINDLATEATTVHSRFPHAVVAFMVAMPARSTNPAQQKALIETLERLARRSGVDGPLYMAEVTTPPSIAMNCPAGVSRQSPPSSRRSASPSSSRNYMVHFSVE